MREALATRIYLVTPPAVDGAFAGVLARLLDRFDVACLRLALPARSEEAVARAAGLLQPLAAARDVPLVVSDHFRLARGLGLDGVHLTDGRQVRDARAALGAGAIVGAFARASRHDGMTAAESGADYVAFGPAGASGLGDGAVAAPDLFAWWAEMIEVPVVAEGALTPQIAAALAGTADFLALGDELWTHPDGPAAALAAFVAHLS